MMKKMVLFISLVVLFVTCGLVCAQMPADEMSVTGTWQLSAVYENAGSESPVLLDPEKAGALYSEKDILYAFYNDGSASMAIRDGGEILTQRGDWTENSGAVTMRLEDSVDTQFTFDAEANVLHRYWKEEQADATYHDLDFVYKRVPAGVWQLNRVFSDGKALDPEEAGALYSERANTYFLFSDWKASVFIEEGGETAAILEGSWRNDGEGYYMEAESFDLSFNYDAEENVLHRYWKSDQADSAYKDLDFVYARVPVGAWQLKEVIGTPAGAFPVVLDPEQAASVYAESDNVYYFFTTGSASVTLPEGAEESGIWTAYDDGFLLTLDDGGEMLFDYDPDQDTLHRYWKDEDPSATYKDLEFVFYPY